MIRVRRSHRPGFTLVEMLVVAALIVVIAGLTVAVLNAGFITSQQVVHGGDRVSGALLIAKQRAKREGAPRGLRFYVNPPNHPTAAGHVTEFQYIESPDAWAPNALGASNPLGGRIVIASMQTAAGRTYPPLPGDTPPPSPPEVYFFTTSATAQSELNEFEQRIEPTGGDYLVLPDFGTSYRITGWSIPAAGGQPILVNGVPISAANARRITLANYPDLGLATSPFTPPPTPVNASYVSFQYGFQSAPRPLLGEPTLQMPSSVIIDYRAPQTVPPFPFPPAPPGALLMNGRVGDVGYRDWSNPSTGAVNPGPYWPTTTAGVYPRTTPDPANPAGPPLVSFDILFSPTGTVLYNPNAAIVLWVRGLNKVDHPRLADPTNPAPTQLDLRSSYDEAGEQVLVTVYVRSGLIATHPVNPPPPTPTYGYDPYKNAKDGQNSGL